jgi:hypothetical protein
MCCREVSEACANALIRFLKLKVSSREINAHFKAGLHIDQYPEQAKPTYKFGDAGSKWRMTKLRRTMEQAEDEGRPLEEVALEKYGVNLGGIFTFVHYLHIHFFNTVLPIVNAKV